MGKLKAGATVRKAAMPAPKSTKGAQNVFTKPIMTGRKPRR
jgi:hypothetical protein